ncbi:asparaginase [Legionella lytica]|uniref:Asparaginase n=1 Tax=Legionella lytica TaxID=96232 RepID=A0ABW8D7E2_9GAMM
MTNTEKIIGIIELGGTISCISEDPTSEFYKGPSASVSSFIKEFKLKPHIKIIIEQFDQRISHEMTIDGLIKLAQRTQSLLDSNDVHGVIITTGTNALEDIAYFIGLTVKSIKPIVFTGSHYPQNSLAFDGKKNLYNAISIASSDKAIKLGVLVTFNDYVITARDAVKNTPGLNNNFTQEGAGVIGHIIGGNFILKSLPLYKHTYQSEFSILGLTNLPKVSIIYAHLGMDDSLIKASISSGVSGIVSAGFGKGYQPNHISQALAKAAQLNIPIVRCSRYGINYTSIDKTYDEKYGFIVAKSLSPHKASLLLSIALNKTKEVKQLQQIFEEY